MSGSSMDKLTALKQYFGHGAFRPGQEALIDALLSGRDALGVMPTGAGKSVCYQLPALLLPGLTLVVSPLISLMKDQVAALCQLGVAAAFINSSLTSLQCREALRRSAAGEYKIVYVAPERLETEDFLRFSKAADISFIAVDEAHCISQWGQDFRPSYLKIAQFVRQLPRRPVLGAFTATATDEVKADILRLLCLERPLTLTTGFDRPNLFYDVARPKDKAAFLLDFLFVHPGCGVVYCATRKGVEGVWEQLSRRGLSVTRYHAGLSDEERRRNQEDFIYDRKRVMVATNAFGMGIDKSNVSFVVHYNMPKSPEAYYQEAGRAGRDGTPADCLLLFSNGDVQTARFLIQNSEDNEALTPKERELVLKGDLERLDKIVGYCKTRDCLRAYLLTYFGEERTPCGNCGNCKGEVMDLDVTLAAQKILSGVARVEKKYAYGLGLTLVMRMLHGSRERRVLELGLDRLPTYGALRDTSRETIREYIDYLVDQGYLAVTQGEYPVLRLGDRAGAVLFLGECVRMPVRKALLGESQRENKPQSLAAPDDGLLSRLKALRMRLAQAAGVPAYIIFSNAALSDMAAKRPRTLSEFLEVSGVGEVKAKRYGNQFLKEIRDWVQGDE